MMDRRPAEGRTRAGCDGEGPCLGPRSRSFGLQQNVLLDEVVRLLLLLDETANMDVVESHG